ncbi:FG-GAP-like repeat-containing protein, partial [Streptomyces parvulus]|uniref:C40 family peptidase n=2 Tax=Streptomyces parvulus TaxID=146923 RepID=UPI0033C9C560
MPRITTLRSTSIALAVTASLSCGLLSVGTAAAAPAPPGPSASVEQQASPGQGPMTPVPGQKTSRTAAAAAPTITRSDVIERAKSWVGIGLEYSWTGSHAGYRTDCSGYVSMAWHLSSSLTTDTFAGAGVIESISKGDLKAGDALLNDNSGANGHVALFEKWANSSQTSYWGYEFTGSGVHHREIPYPYFSGYGTFKPVRNKSVIDDVVVPTDPGMTSLTGGEFSGDGRNDLIAVEVSSGKLFLYKGPNIGTKSSRTEIGTGGWNGMTNLTAGDFNNDGKDDLVATEEATGKLYLYKGNGTGLTARTEIGTGGWNGMTNI